MKGDEMKQYVEVNGEGLEGLMGQTITLFCMSYFYTGQLVGVNTEFVKLKNPKIVYETGPFTLKEWADAQELPNEFWYVRTEAIESFGVMK